MTLQMKSDTMRERLVNARGEHYWRCLDEFADTAEFKEIVEREFPAGAAVWDGNGVSRRNFMKLMGASLALAGLNGCARQPAETIVPYVKLPEYFIPGNPVYFATAMPLSGYGTGLLVESHMGRPTKVEGNPGHPASLGSTDAIAQASVLTMYDPDRAAPLMRAGLNSTWDAFLADMGSMLASVAGQHGAGLSILTETVTSPTLGEQLKRVLQNYPEAKWRQYEPVNRDNVRSGSKLAFGEYVETRYDFSKANVVVSLDAEFVSGMPGSVRYSRDFADKRTAAGTPPTMNRLYTVQCTPTLTGAMGDHILTLRPSQMETFTRALASKLGANVASPDTSSLGAEANAWLDAVAKDLKQNPGATLVVPGEHQPPAVHALTHAINQSLGNVGQTVMYTDPVEVAPTDQLTSLKELVQDMAAGNVKMLLILGGNPVYSSPNDLGFAEALQKVPFSAHLSLYNDETSASCLWHIPETHYLESWSDVRAYDGTVSIIQPLIAPLYNGKSALDLLAVLSTPADQSVKSPYDIVRDYWKSVSPDNFETVWATALSEGLMAGTASPAKSPALTGAIPEAIAPSSRQGLEVVFRPDPTILDGRFANNGWLQELPKPLTKVTWENVVLMSFATAKQLGLLERWKFENEVSVTIGGKSFTAPLWCSPSHPHDCITVFLGYGRTRAGRVGDNIGYNAYSVRTSDTPWFVEGAQVKGTGGKINVARTEEHQLMEIGEVAEHRHLVRVGTLEEFTAEPTFAQEMAHEFPPEHSMYAPAVMDGNQWGMTIDLNRCTGCNACAIACQSENNIPVVGKEQVEKGREMHWIRIDRYYKGADLDTAETVHQPVPCMQCEKASCEVVCPVAATVHSAEGLNDMVYNRCVGTRYCSNNCPYKVRRFNFLQFSDMETESLKGMRNPDVTVRTRGVMEKCTYCVQRINQARQVAKRENREIRDGEVITACQAACPAAAITFGNINDANSAVTRAKKDPRNYTLLPELQTRPRTTYLAKLRNPNPELQVKESHGAQEAHHG